MPVPLPDLPEDNTGICLVIPNSVEFRRIYMGALLILQQWWYYDVENAEQAEDVIQRVAECHYLTSSPEFEDCDVFNCDDVVDCIENNEATQNALSNLFGSGSNTEVFNGTYANDNFSSENGGVCDDDALFGQIDAFLEWINAKTEDMLEQFEENTNIFEAIGVAEDIPIFGVILDAVGSELATEYMEFVLDSVSENYLSEWTVELKDQLECEIYCHIKEGKGCEWSITDMADFYAQKLLTSFDLLDTVADILTFVTLGAWAGPQYVYVMHLVVIGSTVVEKLVAGVAWKSLQRAIFASTPSNEWTLCDPCDTCNLPIVIDFEDGTAGNCATIDEGTIQASPAIGDFALVYTINNATVDPTINIVIDQTGVRDITVEWWQYWDSTLTSPRNITQQVRVYDADENLLDVSASVVSRPKDTWVEVSEVIVGTSADIKRIEVKSAFLAGATPVTVAIDDITIETP